jgi:hypothetical protein
MGWTGSKIFGFESLDEVMNGFSFRVAGKCEMRVPLE